VVGDYGEEIKGGPYGSTLIGRWVPQQRRAMPILGGVQTGPEEDEDS
jgi:hypothetical protein